MKGFKVMAILLVLLAVPFLGKALAEDEHTIHPFEHGTTISRTSPSGQQIGCLTSGTPYTLMIDFYYVDQRDDDQWIYSLSFESGDGSDPNSYSLVGFPVTWEYSYDGISWTPYSGFGWLEVPWSGKNAVGQLDGTEAHVIVRVTFPVTGNLGDTFYYRVHFTSKYKGTEDPGNSGNHYFWYDICSTGAPEIPFGPEVLSAIGLLALSVVTRKRNRK